MNHDIPSIAKEYINSTNRTIFLTGKAGTGKTTLLKEILQTTHKKVMVAAPTGIAAINAGGVTLHSLFQLPFGAFVPDRFAAEQEFMDFKFTTPKTIFKGLRLHENKRNLLREMELLIIDEVSMLRSDTLDAIDHILRWVRKDDKSAFGGVQVLFIGDLQQLPPVVKDQEWNLLSNYYRSSFFFDALVLQKLDLITLELSKIYRQSDERFVHILNKVRHNRLDEESVQVLNSHVNVNWRELPTDGQVFLTTHNRKADLLNEQSLEQIAEKEYSYEAEIRGDFKEYAYPIPQTLRLKKGAQVMFVKNDYSGEQRYFNGKIGKVLELDEDSIEVGFKDEQQTVYLDRYQWENKRYKLDKESNEIKEDVIGTFSHFPVKLAWAITIHKSQGLTFSKAVLDISEAFAAGQVYVALSRLSSLEGLVLTEPVSKEGIATQQELKAFEEESSKPIDWDQSLLQSRNMYLRQFLISGFEFGATERQYYYHMLSYNKEESHSSKQRFKEWAQSQHQEVLQLKAVGDKFKKQLERFFLQEELDIALVEDRVAKAVDYFDPLIKQLIARISEHKDEVRKMKKVKAYQTELHNLSASAQRDLLQIHKAQLLFGSIAKGEELTKTALDEKMRQVLPERSTGMEQRKVPKSEKKNTKLITFELFSEGKDIETIANERNLAPSTIVGHLVHYVKSGEINVDQLLSEEKRENIITVAEKIDSTSLSEIKAKLGDEYEYSDIKLAMAYLQWQSENEGSPAA